MATKNGKPGVAASKQFPVETRLPQPGLKIMFFSGTDLLFLQIEIDRWFAKHPELGTHDVVMHVGSHQAPAIAADKQAQTLVTILYR